jgi:hypothetical protein
MKLSQLEEITGIRINFNEAVSTGTYSVYAVTAIEGNKLLFDVIVDSKDMIHISFPDALTAIETGQKAKVRVKMTDAGVDRRVSSDGIREYIYPRVSKFMASYYVK